MKVEIEKKLINKIVKVFKKRRKIFKIGIMLGKRERNLITVDGFINPKQTYKNKGMVAEISNDEYSNIINKYGKKAIGFIFYMKDNNACDTNDNSRMRERCSGFGMIDLSLTINAKGKHSFHSDRELDVKVK